ncbi:MAG: maleylacetoacetate isomerase, partial [Candidatus Binataceae bacterium]
ASYRVRIALELKGLPYDYASVHLRRGEQLSADFRAINPQGLVPALIDNGATLTQSLAIIEYLEETHPQPPLLPSSAAERARVRALAQTVACEIHPLDNLKVLNYLRQEFSADDAKIRQWYHHWLREGFAALEPMLAQSHFTERFCHGDSPGMADICLVPQIANAERFRFDMSPYPLITRIGQSCLELEAFQRAAPERQPDAE